MAVVFLTSFCYCCNHVFSSNPRFVPSIQNEPICRVCMETINAERERRQLEPFAIHPQAYEPIDEQDL